MKIKDIIGQFIAGDWGEETCSNEAPCAVTCIRGADIIPISEYNFSTIPIRYISQQSYSKKCLQVGDIIIEKSGGSPTQSTGRVSFLSQELLDSVGPVVCSNFCTAFRVKKGWNPLYVYYYFQFIYNLGLFFNFEGKTSGLKNLQLDAAFAAIPIEDVSESTQNRIVAVLQSLEKKITINRRINQNLEAMAKQLYEYWFIQFDFPNKDGKPYKSSGGEMVWNEKLKREIPKEWCSHEIKDFMRIFTGKKDVSKAIPGKYKFFSCAPEPITSNEYIYDGAAVLVSGNGSYTGRVSFYKGKFDLYQRTYACVLDAETENIPFFFYTLRYLFQPAYSGGKHGSSIPYIVLSDLANFKFAYNKLYLEQFISTIKPLFDQQSINMEELESLTKQRDKLLPLLMNGQVLVNSDLSLG